MRSPPQSWRYSHPLSPQHSNEIENRLTLQEAETAYQRDLNEDVEKQLERHSSQLTLHERAILIILGLLQILMQERYPVIAKVIKELLPSFGSGSPS